MKDQTAAAAMTWNQVRVNAGLEVGAGIIGGSPDLGGVLGALFCLLGALFILLLLLGFGPCCALRGR